MRPEAPLSALDAYLRERWFDDEPEVASAFAIEGTQYLSGVPEEFDEVEDLQTVDVDIGAVLRPRMAFSYTFDPHHPIEVEGKVFDPYPCPERLIDAESDSTVATVARNDTPEPSCSTCDARATQICALCAAADEPELGPFACEECAGRHEGPLDRLANRPRAGFRPNIAPEPDDDKEPDGEEENADDSGQ